LHGFLIIVYATDARN